MTWTQVSPLPMYDIQLSGTPDKCEYDLLQPVWNRLLPTEVGSLVRRNGLERHAPKRFLEFFKRQVVETQPLPSEGALYKARGCVRVEWFRVN